MICLMCGCEHLLPGERKRFGYIGGKSYRFITPVMICIECENNFISETQRKEFMKRLLKAEKQKTI